jgi:hypothetical protein
MTFNAIPVRGDAGQVLAAAAPGAPLDAAPTGTTTSVACYLRNGTDVTWQWGLNDDNSWYVLNGQWITTPYSGLTKFVTSAGQGDLVAAANNAIRYYQRTGYTVEAVLAADSSSGYSYPIVSNGLQLFPRF